MAAVALAVFLAAYLGDAGLGFIVDDFAWIRHGQIHQPGDIVRVSTTAVGFYRPLVSLSFGIDYALFGIDPKPYGLTNLSLALTCALLVFALARALRLSREGATVASVLWLFNFHGINMAVLWLSGRTSLLLTLFALGTALSFLNNRPVLMALSLALALLSKEEAVLLPLMLTLWFRVEPAADAGATLSRRHALVAAWLVLGGYLAVRFGSGAFWPGNAPEYYRPVQSLGHLVRNVLEYADRSATFSAAAVLLMLGWTRRWISPDTDDRVRLRLAVIWVACGFGLTVFLPVRSSLYAVLPSVGIVIAAATIAMRLTHATPASQRLKMWACGLVIITALLPVYWSRNVRWTELAALSSAAAGDLVRYARVMDEGGTVLIHDDQSTRVSLKHAWGTLVADMAAMYLGGRITVRVTPPAPGTPGVDARGLEPPPSHVLVLRDGRLVSQSGSD